MRYEKKYRITNLSKAFIVQNVLAHPAGFRPIYHARQINNIYFDTPNLSAYDQNVAGINERKKFRVRWYGETQQPTKVNVEIKIKQHELGKKIVHPIASFSLNNLQGLIKKVNELSETNAVLRPVLLNTYQRIYFRTPDKKYRITIDDDLQYSSLLHGVSFNFHSCLTKEDAVILEIKYEETADDEWDFISQFLPFRQTKNSKYVNGVFLTMGHL